jgi:hypothetical protein
MDKYIIIRNAITPEVCELIKTSIKQTRDIAYCAFNTPLTDKIRFADTQVPVSFSVDIHPTTEALLVNIQSLVESFTEKQLYPTYSYARIYCKGSKLDKHIDRESCEYSVTVCIDNDPLPWPIFMESNPVILNSGDIIIYKGLEADHWREELNLETEIVQCFLHYVDANGKYADHKFDKRPMIGYFREPHKQDKVL